MHTVRPAHGGGPSTDSKATVRALGWLCVAVLVVVGAGTSLLRVPATRPAPAPPAAVTVGCPVSSLAGVELGASEEEVREALGLRRVSPPWMFHYAHGGLQVFYAEEPQGARALPLGKVLGVEVTLNKTTRAQLEAALGPPAFSDAFGLSWISGDYAVGFAFEAGSLVKVMVGRPALFGSE